MIKDGFRRVQHLVPRDGRRAQTAFSLPLAARLESRPPYPFPEGSHAPEEVHPALSCSQGRPVENATAAIGHGRLDQRLVGGKWGPAECLRL